jgi:hypothetical protein
LPSDRVRHLSVEEVLAVHAAVLGRFGGRPGVRDAGLLESGTADRERLDGWIRASIRELA